MKVSFAGELRHVRATSALKELVRGKGLEIGFRMRIFVESVVDGWPGIWFCLSLSAFRGCSFPFQVEAGIQFFECPGRGKEGKRKKERSEEFPVCGRLRLQLGLGKSGVRIEKLTVLIRTGLIRVSSLLGTSAGTEKSRQ